MSTGWAPVPVTSNDAPSNWSVADSGPWLDGLNVTLAVQLFPPPTLDGQPVTWKSPASGPVM